MKLQYTDQSAPDTPPRSLEVRRVVNGLEVELEGRTYRVEGGYTSPGVLQIRIDGRPLRVVTAAIGEGRLVARGSERLELRRLDNTPGRRSARHAAHDHGELTSSMPGLVLRVLAAEGESVKKGQTLVIIEAMKMEHEVKAPRDGRVRRVSCTAGGMVSPGVALVEIEGDPAAG